MREEGTVMGYHFQCTTCATEWDETRIVTNGVIDFSDLECPNGCNKQDDKLYWDDLEIPEIIVEEEVS